MVEHWLQEQRWLHLLEGVHTFLENDLLWQEALSECLSAGAGAAMMGGGIMAERTAAVTERAKDCHER